MLIQITARHMDVPAKLKSYIENRVEKLDKFIDGITDVRVTLSTEKHRQIAELNIRSRGGVHMSATEATDDLKSSVTQALEKIQGQAKKHRAKRIDKKRRRAPMSDGEGTFNILAGGAELCSRALGQPAADRTARSLPGAEAPPGPRATGGKDRP